MHSAPVVTDFRELQRSWSSYAGIAARCPRGCSGARGSLAGINRGTTRSEYRHGAQQWLRACPRERRAVWRPRALARHHNVVTHSRCAVRPGRSRGARRRSQALRRAPSTTRKRHSLVRDAGGSPCDSNETHPWLHKLDHRGRRQRSFLPLRVPAFGGAALRLRRVADRQGGRGGLTNDLGRTTNGTFAQGQWPKQRAAKSDLAMRTQQALARATEKTCRSNEGSGGHRPRPPTQGGSAGEDLTTPGTATRCPTPAPSPGDSTSGERSCTVATKCARSSCGATFGDGSAGSTMENSWTAARSAEPPLPPPPTRPGAKNWQRERGAPDCHPDIGIDGGNVEVAFSARDFSERARHGAVKCAVGPYKITQRREGGR
jgi:hypothetical protein